MKTRRSLFTFLLLLQTVASFAALSPNDRQVFLRVNPLAGLSQTSKSGGNNGWNNGWQNSSWSSSQSMSKTVRRNMKWNCEVRYRGVSRPEKVEIRAFYIGYEGKSMTPKILGKDVKSLTVDANGKASVEIESPTVTMQRTRTGGGLTGYSGRISSSSSTTTGQRMAGCVVQLWEDGALVKSYASMSQWETAAKNPEFSDVVLNQKPKNRLN